MDPVARTAREHAELVALLDRRAALRAALDLLAAEGDVAWVAEPAAVGGDLNSGDLNSGDLNSGDLNSGNLALGHVRGDRTGLLRGLPVGRGLGLTGKVYGAGSPSWVDDYLRAADITHTFDDLIDAEGIRRLLAVPILREGRVLGVLAVGPRSEGTFGDRSVERAREVADEVALAVAVAERAARPRGRRARGTEPDRGRTA